MDKSHLLNQQFQNVNQSVDHQKVRNDCDKKCTKKNNRNYNIRAFQETWKMKYLVSPIPDRLSHNA